MPSAPLRPSRSRGFTLIELMVGMVLGMLTVLVVTQVTVFSQARKRTAVAGQDATVNGALALYTLERDAKNAGFGVTPSAEALGCTIKARFGGTDLEFTLSPVTITQGAHGAPDSIAVISSAKLGITLPTRVNTDHPKAAANFFVDSVLGVDQGDFMLAVPATCDAHNWASLFQVTNAPGTALGQNEIIHDSGRSDWNQPGGLTIFPDAGYPAGSLLLNLGSFLRHVYLLSDGHLQLQSLDMGSGTNATTDLFPEVVQLQAEYGKDPTPADGALAVTTWDTATPTTAAGWQEVKAIRVALVARSPDYEKLQKDGAGQYIQLAGSHPDAVDSTADCSTASPDPRALCWAGGALDVALTSEDPANADPDPNDGLPRWQHYRYRVYESVLPIRNVIWHQ